MNKHYKHSHMCPLVDIRSPLCSILLYLKIDLLDHRVYICLASQILPNQFSKMLHQFAIPLAIHESSS
jgi:hypothetical protein